MGEHKRLQAGRKRDICLYRCSNTRHYARFVRLKHCVAKAVFDLPGVGAAKG